jgi:hypothetical protein
LHLRPGMAAIDLGSGKGEMLCRWASRYAITGTGVDIHPPFVTEAVARADELGVAEKVTFVAGDGAEHIDEPNSYDLGMAVGTTWIGGGLLGTIDLLSKWTKPRSLLAMGEVFWAEEPTPELREIRDLHYSFVDLVGTLDRITSHGFDLVDMVIASADDWDRYEAGMWPNVVAWLDANPDDPLAEEVRQGWKHHQRAYLAAGRRCLGWGVFVVRASN